MNNENKSEVDKFFETLPSEDKKEADVFEDKKPSIENKAPEKENDEDEPHKNRRQRRLEQKYQQERESNIVLAERLRAATELDKAKKENPNIDARLIEIFGTEETGKKLAKHFSDLLSETREGAREETLREIAQLESNEKAEVEQAETQIDEELEAIEDAYGVDLTSNTKEATSRRQQFLTLVEKMSPKDEDGTITDYADFQSVYEVYSTTANKVDNSRQKEIASRSMQRSGSSKSESRPRTPGFDGWRADYGLN
jgi:hypothetical protein